MDSSFLFAEKRKKKSKQKKYCANIHLTVVDPTNRIINTFNIYHNEQKTTVTVEQSKPIENQNFYLFSFFFFVNESKKPKFISYSFVLGKFFLIIFALDFNTALFFCLDFPLNFIFVISDEPKMRIIKSRKISFVLVNSSHQKLSFHKKQRKKSIVAHIMHATT